ncbi:MAG: bifunctional helix-turn-helix transcriptional regulator/GNAT family N-acetyltransferase [Betaproteobacteria bacterium]|nr:bifunctional helix-turn-helix transcriptional regulator/GNAT family N-acetyltransferase [Betaproteobacteria bacterium]
MNKPTALPPASTEQIAAVRRFNRFHTQLVGALNGRMLASEYSLPEVRILYEIANAPAADAVSAATLGRSLALDPGYLSRLISGLEKNGLLTRLPTKNNAKQLNLVLTRKGKATFAKLNSASANEVAALLSKLTASERRQLVGAMRKIERLLKSAPPDRTFTLRDPEPGDLGWITHRHGALYAQEYGWDWTFEALVAEIVGKFAKEFLPGKERCWVAEREGEIIGSIFLMRQDDETAKLRLLYVEPSARGLGLGRRLVDECIRFAQAKGYRRMVLWTNDILVSARRIYEAAGFSLIEEETHHSFGRDLVGQVWSREL